jgi:hypothetical protein
MLVTLYVLVDDWWKRLHSSSPRKLGRPPSLSDAEVLTLTILSQWHRLPSERDFFRFADAHLRAYFPKLLFAEGHASYLHLCRFEARALRPASHLALPQLRPRLGQVDLLLKLLDGLLEGVARRRRIVVACRARRRLSLARLSRWPEPGRGPVQAWEDSHGQFVARREVPVRTGLGSHALHVHSSTAHWR